MAPTASADEIRAAYRALARRLHPDAHRDSDGSEMAAVNVAWDVLSDPARRARYDAELRPVGLPPRPTEDVDWRLADTDEDIEYDEGYDDEGTLSPEEARAALGFGCLVGATAIIVVIALVVLFIYAFLRSPVG